MRVGLDLDNVISNFNDVLLEEYIEYDKKLRNNGIINKNAKYIRNGMFDFTEEEENTFYKNNIERIANKLTPLPYCKEVIKKLREKGIEIYIITARDNGDYANPLDMTKKWLKKYDIEYDKLIVTKKLEKGIVCEENYIEIMIDDSVNNLKEIKDHDVKCLLMSTRYNQYDTEFEIVDSWNKIYDRLLKEMIDNEKINVILDTDICNECDDQFAFAYLLKSQERFNIEAITIAPFNHKNGFTIEENINKSYDELVNLSNYLNFNYKNKIFKGAKEYLNKENIILNEASKKIIEIAKKNDKTYIIAIGAITNIAIAILQEPSIVDKIEIVWLGGNYLLCKDNNEFNFKQDVDAVKNVFNSGVKLTVIPAKGVASNLMISIYELEHNLRNKNELANHLCDIFYNDGVHGIQKRRVIWDISAVAYLINSHWFEKIEISVPNIKEDLSYEFNNNKNKISFVTYLNSKKIYGDLFRKLGN